MVTRDAMGDNRTAAHEGSPPRRTGPVRPIYAEDLEIGVRYDAGSHAMTEAEIVEFAEAWDPQFFHTDPDAAADSYFGGLIASGIHTLAVFQRLAAAAHFSRWNVIAGRRLNELNFLRPVRPGDVLSCSFVVDRIVFDARARADIRIVGQLENQRGVRVLEFVMDSLIQSRSAAER